MRATNSSRPAPLSRPPKRKIVVLEKDDANVSDEVDESVLVLESHNTVQFREMFYHLVGAQAGEVRGAKTVLGAQTTSQQAYLGGVCPKSDRPP